MVTIAYAHNLAFDLWLRLGLIGLTLFFVAVADSVLGGLRAWRRHADPRTAALALALVAVVAGLVATGFLEPLLDEYRFATLFGVSLGMLRACVTSMNTRPRPLTWHVEAVGIGAGGRSVEVGVVTVSRGDPCVTLVGPGAGGMIVLDRESLVGWPQREQTRTGPPPRICAGSRLARTAGRGWCAGPHGDRSCDSSREAGMDVRQVVRTVRANWIVALVTFLACLFIGGAYAVLPTKVYQASVVLVAQPPAGASDPGPLVGAIQIEIPQIAVEEVLHHRCSGKRSTRCRALPDGAGDHLGDR